MSSTVQPVTHAETSRLPSHRCSICGAEWDSRTTHLCSADAAVVSVHPMEDPYQAAKRKPTRDELAVGAQRLADEVRLLIRRRVIDSRSPAGDAVLDLVQTLERRFPHGVFKVSNADTIDSTPPGENWGRIS